MVLSVFAMIGLPYDLLPVFPPPLSHIPSGGNPLLLDNLDVVLLLYDIWRSAICFLPAVLFCRVLDIPSTSPSQSA
jgi:hypothetical protein